MLLKIIRKTIGLNILLFKLLSFVKLSFLTRFLPICNISTFPKNITRATFKEMAILDTFDQYSPMYDNPQIPKNVEKMFKQNNIRITFSGDIYYGDQGKAYILRGIK